MKAYVITKWFASNQANADGNFIEITGRREGIIPFILSLVGLSSTLSVRVSADRLVYHETSLAGDTTTTTPLSKVTSTTYGWERPIKKCIGIVIGTAFVGHLLGAIIGGGATAMENPAVALSSGLLGGAVGLIIGGIIAAIYYLLNRVLTTGVVTDASDHFWVRFKRSVIEGKKLDQSDAEYVAELIDYLVQQKN
jgi:hypothetical protein